jgi:MATE family multidrug resistance protein
MGAVARAAFPLVITFAGNNLLGVVDTAMVGRLGAPQLAGVALGNAVFYTVTVAAMGIVFGMDPIVSQALGAGEGARARAALRAGLRLSLVVTAPVIFLLALAPLLFGAVGIEPLTARYAAEFLWARAPGAIPFLLVIAMRSYLQGRTFTRPLVLGVIAANVVNLVGNGLLIFGDGALVELGLPSIGLPALGVLGSGLASALASFAQLGIIYAGFRKLAPAGGGGDLHVPWRLVTKVGIPIGLTLLAEVGAFSLAGVLAARIGPAAASGHQVAITLASLTFTAAMGIANATSVRVGRAVGRGDPGAARLSGIAGFTTSTLYMSVTAAAFLLFPSELAGTMSDRPEVLATAIPLLYVAAAFQLFDGAQVVGAGALRGIGETRFIQNANIIGYYVIGLPISLVLAFGLGMNERGLWWGLCVGLAFVAAALFWRFLAKSRGAIARL